ncbi:MAG TPA: DPP IV N-terminal domain-containing protein [Flavisolibacter sp.]|nr:DPP IV N-terminal domain-containing protein [Flavisolibacter sp.]
MRSLFLLLFFVPLLTIAQKQKITLEDIFKKPTFRGEYVAGFDKADDEQLFDPASVTDASGKKIDTKDFMVSADKKRILFFTGRESIYRRSSKSTVYIYDIASKKTIELNKGKILHPTFSPDGSKIAYVFENNLYVYDIAAGKTTPITTDGKWNQVINGNCDWVYEEEFEFTRAFEWSPNGTYIAYYKFDESKVKEYEFTVFDNAYNEQYTYKYPKAGEQNSKVDIHIYNVINGQDVKAKYLQGDIYIPRIKWTQQDDKLVIYWMNRHQDDLKLLMTDASTGDLQTMYEENNKYYVEINDNWWFLKDGKNFMFTSEKNGYNQLYLYSIDGKKRITVSKMKYDIAEVNSVDENARMVYYTLAYPTAMDRNVFASDFDGRNTYMLTKGTGWHRVEFNKDYSQFYDYYSNINTPQTVALYSVQKDKKGLTAVLSKTINENEKLKKVLGNYELGTASFLRIPNSKGDTLNGWMLKPGNFDPNKKYPVLFCNYGGPGSQQVVNRYGAASMWHQLLAQNGFIIVSVDNTGTGFRGEEFKKKTYLQLGKFEIEDQIDAAKYLGTLPYVDKNRIGHWGWSFGGFMSSLAITKGSDVFKAAIAVAPVTSWRFYDNIYTERYMRTPQENADGYDKNSPINFTDKIKGKFLLIHGTADDNVHFQNSVEMVKALVKSNIDFESAYYPNKNHGISGMADNTSFHLWSKMTNWLYENLRDNKTPLGLDQDNSKKNL